MSLKRSLSPEDDDPFSEYCSPSRRRLTKDENLVYASLLSTPFNQFTPEKMGDVVSSGQGEMICYGMILDEKVRLMGKGEELENRTQQLMRDADHDNVSQSITLGIYESTEGQLFLEFGDDMDLGYLSEKITNAWKMIIKNHSIEFDAVTNLSTIAESVRRAKKLSDAVICVNIYVYGPESDCDEVGNELSNNGLFLQVPDERRSGTRYNNPHISQLSDIDGSDTQDSDDDECNEINNDDHLDVPSDGQSEDFQETMAEVFSSMTRAAELNPLQGSDNLNKALYKHQEEDLRFMIQRETGDIPTEYRLWKPENTNGKLSYCHAITKQKLQELPDESSGGILANEMGMGKSLTTLALITKTLIESQRWVKEQKELLGSSLVKQPCQATLIIVPSLILINTWMKEIKEHLDGSLKIITYHGRGRERVVEDIEHCNIIITTYGSLAREHNMEKDGGKKSSLHNFAWYRVVLDEAHTIRRQATTFYQAAVDLSAKYRWCLSGTPVQNSLRDLGSLLGFIQAKPFNNPADFRYWIINPFEEQAKRRQAIEGLVQILDSVCLRRTIERINLPAHREETHFVELIPEEQYENTLQAMDRLIKQQNSERKQNGPTFGIFQIYLELRSFCNHGTYQPPFSWVKRNLMDEDADTVCSIIRTSQTRCMGCRIPIPIVTREKRPRYGENCNHHVLCDECSQVANKRSDANNYIHCPLCESFRILQDLLTTNNLHTASGAKKAEKDNDRCLQSGGYSSKMNMLVDDIKKDLSSKKSLVFSCGTRTLDLIERHFNAGHIRFSRVDGNTPSSLRQEILDEFDKTENIPVLMMTTGTGAFGLNLQSVNRVFIVEPQWNPSVEIQAIARAIRLGQQQQVLVIRHCVKDSIEEEMCSQQTPKLELGRMKFRKEP